MPAEDIPVYLFLGFLEGGKTKFIQETLEDPSFNNGERTLLVVCEEGIEEYSPETWADKGKRVKMLTIEDIEDFTPETLEKARREAGATRVMIEYNGMWMVNDLFEKMPIDWAVYQVMCFVDAGTFLSYNANMRSLVVDKFTVSELVVFNRFDVKTMDQMALHKLVRGVSRRAQIAYETTDGEVGYDDIQDPLPFDMKAPEVTIQDEDFAVFYRDIMDDPDKWDGKNISFRVIASRGPKFPPHTFAAGRQVMTCCVQDIQFCWLVSEWDRAEQFDHDKGGNQWAQVTATVHVRRHKFYRKRGPVLEIRSLTPAPAPKEEVATFY